MPKLTDLFIDKLPLSQDRVTHWDTLLPAFGIRVGARSKTFLVIDSAGSRRKLGAYPAMKLSEARDAARKCMQGAPESTTTYSEVLEGYVSQHLWKNCRPANAKELERILRKHFTFTGPIAQISKRDIAQVIESIEAPSAANHATTAIKMLFSWAEKRGYLDHNTIAKLPRPYDSPSRSRVLTPDELKRVWIASKQLSYFGRIVRLCILSGLRRGELAWVVSQSKFFETSADHLVIDADVAKNGVTHTTPLTANIRTCLHTRPVSPTRFNAWSKPMARLRNLSAVDDFSCHDLRRTFASLHGEIGTDTHLIRRLLGHSPQSIEGVTSIYNRHQYLPQLLEAQLRYEAHLVKLGLDL